MATDFRQGVNYGPVIAALLRKSLEGKIDWRETAEDEAYLASVRGEMTFEISRRGDACELIAKDQRGRTVFRVDEPFILPHAYWTPLDQHEADQTGDEPVSTLGHLHTVARRVAMRVDERLTSSLRLIEGL
ncbi:MAG: hypothetical protein M3552_17060 [Planctomycetota bacterium]|nr:hypothetical protein [Planctomycetota bacterium]